MAIKVAVFGSGGLAKEVLGYLGSEYEVLCVVSSQPFNNPLFDRFRVVDRLPDDMQDVEGILAVGEPAIKRAIVAKNPAVRWRTYVHPSAHVSPFAKLGRGCLLTPQAIAAADCILEDFVFFNTNATVGHDSIIRSYTSLMPNSEVCGSCDIGEDCFIGINASIVPNVKLAAGVKVSAGAIVRKSILEAVTVYGDPAKPRPKAGET